MKVACAGHISVTTQSQSSHFQWAGEPVRQCDYDVGRRVAMNYWDGRDSSAARKLCSAFTLHDDGHLENNVSILLSCYLV